MNVEELLPPPEPPRRPFPWRLFGALFVPAAALAAGTGLQRFLDADAPDPVLRWLAWSSACGVLVGAAVGLFRKSKLGWSAYGLAAPWLTAAVVLGAMKGTRPLRESLADRREAACRAEGRKVCTVNDFSARCAQAQKDPAAAQSLLGEARSKSCNGQSCTMQWLYAGPFRPEQYPPAGALACFVMTDAQGHGLRHWFMTAEAP